MTDLKERRSGEVKSHPPTLSGRRSHTQAVKLLWAEKRKTKNWFYNAILGMKDNP
jgi:hypothetical protein